eukprot:CAMPEP_0195019440 /NCGR_PEP_ID=MMETSP0326_2-20130528/32769_1 /TAXON_ID=2866 ORGANISM="Crypthecodinium cohnii, Strain Seligo" /NCGR_SAMPLE_ID=MMETSP0326_2 /ASSEMBLY_ACC=CAM_ASM_000348 /LENGTH=64 /DNA_ID=CAMNT_0040037489 /DNA_START=381 /DNA_END=572 /DNA_ORIENTATION=+
MVDELVMVGPIGLGFFTECTKRFASELTPQQSLDPQRLSATCHCCMMLFQLEVHACVGRPRATI